MHLADVILGGVNLDPVHTVQLGFAHGGTREPWRIDVLVFRKSFEEAYRLSVVVVVAGSLVDGLADDLHPRTLNYAGIDRVAQFDGVVSTARVHIQHGREASVEIDLSIRQRDDRALSESGASRVHVNVRINHAGHHRNSAEVDNPRLRRNLHGSTYI